MTTSTGGRKKWPRETKSPIMIREAYMIQIRSERFPPENKTITARTNYLIGLGLQCLREMNHNDEEQT